MQKDFKIGVALGLLLVACVSLWLAVQPSLSIKARMADDSLLVDTAAPLPQTPPASGPPPMLAAESAEPKTRIHIVQRGETLSSISKQYYGTTTKWQKILDANRSILKNPNSLTPGSKLLIPE